MKKVFLGFGVFFFLLITIGFFLPTSYVVKNKRTINASKKIIHTVIGDLRTWKNWGTWMLEDPSLNIIVEKHEGVGATQRWERKGGSGTLTFTHVDPQNGIAYDLQFDGFPKAVARFNYKEITENETEVTWQMNGDVPIPVIGGYMAMFFKDMIGKSFDGGLKNIAGIVEGQIAK